MNVRDEDFYMWCFICETLARYASKFDLKLKEIKGPKKKWRGKYVASCSKHGVIRVALQNEWGKMYEAYQLIDTMAHELAHLRHQKHSSQWFELYMQILDLMRVSGVYRHLRELMGKKSV